MRWYILDDDDNPVLESDPRVVARWFEQHQERKRVVITKLETCIVSTVFLGLDHNYHDAGPPILFETMVFGGPLDGTCERYTTRGEALHGHADMIEWAKSCDCPKERAP